MPTLRVLLVLWLLAPSAGCDREPAGSAPSSAPSPAPAPAVPAAETAPAKPDADAAGPDVAPAPADTGGGAAAAARPLSPEEVEAAIATPSDVAAPPAGAQKSASGLAWRVLHPGTGTAHPGPQDAVLLHYTVWTTDGRRVDSSVKRGEPRWFRLDGQIPGWTEGAQLLVAGEKRRFWIPQKLAYKGRAGKPRGTLVVDMEMLDLRRAPPAPADVARPPADATKTPSGLAYKVLQAGTGKVHPGPTHQVMVHYDGWTTDGVCFDSSALEGTPAQFGLDGVIAGWTEGVQLMVKGDRTRFWIPQALAYKGEKGKPKGMLVFDIELIDFGP